MSNFQFLESHWTDLAKLGDLSENKQQKKDLNCLVCYNM